MVLGHKVYHDFKNLKKLLSIQSVKIWLSVRSLQLPADVADLDLCHSRLEMHL